MGCACKTKKKLEEKYGVNKRKRRLRDKLVSAFYKTILFAIATCLALILVPIVLIVWIGNSIFNDNKPIPLPKFLTKIGNRQ
jgi:hypothetical protein